MKNLIFKYEGTKQCKRALELINKNNKSQYAGKNKLYYSTDSNCYIKEELEDFENITDIVVPASKIIEFFEEPKQAQVTELEMQVNFRNGNTFTNKFDNNKMHEFLKQPEVESVIIKQVNTQFTAFKKVIESDNSLIDKYNECKSIFNK